MNVELIPRFQRPSNTSMRILRIFLCGEIELDARFRVEVCSMVDKEVYSANKSLTIMLRPSTIAKRFHRLTHANADETERFVKEGGD